MGTTQLESFHELDAEENIGGQQRGRNRRT
jgi:hypothetical protein